MKAVPFDLFASPRSRPAPGGAADNPLSVGDLALQTREVIESRLRPVWVRGEISDFKHHRNGHWYFCLRDKAAQIRCVVWSGDQHRMPAPPDDGMQVVLFGQMTVYTARTDLQLKVTRIDAEGDGLWRKAMEVTLAKLRREGLLDESRKRPIPHFPRIVAVVTSPDGAALSDIVAVMRKRNLGARLVLCPAKVQGDGAALEIAAAAACASRDEVNKALSLAKRDLSDALVGRIQYARQHIVRLARSVAHSSTRIVTRKKALLGTSAARLNALSPLATLSRGYAVARDRRGRALTSARQFSPGFEFNLLLHDGRINAKSEKVVVDENLDEGRPLTQTHRNASA